jgi:hypothetical protein
MAVGRAVVWFGVFAVLASVPALAADTGNGSKNFRTPNTVPNYFSNEAGPLLGPTVETQRGPIYPSQTPSQPPPPVPTAAFRGREHLAIAVPHLTRGRHAPQLYAHHVAIHGRIRGPVVAHGGARGHLVHNALVTRPVSKATRVNTAHHHARG